MERERSSSLLEMGSTRGHAHSCKSCQINGGHLSDLDLANGLCTWHYEGFEGKIAPKATLKPAPNFWPTYPKVRWV